MYKVLIADDEPKIGKFIQKLVDWKALDAVVVGVALTGIDALAMIQETNPDIVITDIRMPGCDGLEIIRRAKEQGYHPYFIIISGYRHFEYAHNALKYNVEDYLLKPISKDKLEEALKNICNKIIICQGKIKKDLIIKAQLENDRANLRQHFSSLLQQSPDLLTSLNFVQIAQDYQIHFQDGLFQAILFKLDITQEDTLDQSHSKALKKVKMIVEKTFSPLVFDCACGEKSYALLALINYSPEHAIAVEKSFRPLFEEIHVYVDMFEQMHLTIGLGAVRERFSEIADCIGTAEKAVWSRLLLGCDRIIDGAVEIYCHAPLSKIYGQKQELQLMNAIESLNIQGFESFLQSTFDAYSQTLSMHPHVLFQLVESIEETSNRILMQQAVEGKNAAPRMQLAALAENTTTVQQLHDYIADSVTQVLKQLQQSKRMQDSRPIRLARTYIQEHFHEQLLLEDVALYVHLNPTYFSSVFKKETGENFSDYLIRCRINEAKTLLKQSDKSIGCIAREIGYAETKYFSKLFNKVVGLKPSQYRRFHA